MDRVEKVLYTEKQVLAGIKKLANKLNKKFIGKNPLMLGIFNGVVPFYANLSLRLKFDHEYDFIKCSSYVGTKQIQDVEIFWHKKRDLKNRHVILVDDIFDSGKTMTRVAQLLKEAGAKSVTTVVLLDKVPAHPKNLKPDYSCFEIPNEWIVGYGLDTNGKMRNLPCIGVLREDLKK